MSGLIQPETLPSPVPPPVKVLKPLQDFSLTDILAQTSNAVVGTVNDIFSGNIIDDMKKDNRYMWLALVVLILTLLHSSL